MDKNSIKSYGSLILVFALWGSLYVVSKSVLMVLPTFTVAFFRFVVAYITLFAISGGKKINIERKDTRYVIMIAALGYFAGVSLQLIGTKLLGASFASLLNSMNPVFMTLFGVMLMAETLTPYKVIGIVVSIIGVFIIVGGVQTINTIGLILSILSVIVWSYTSVMTKAVSTKYDPILFTRRCIGIAVCFYVPMFVYELPHIQLQAITLTPIVGLAYMGIFCTGLTFYLWNKCLSQLGASNCSVFYPVQPVIATLLGIIFLHEQLTTQFVVGSVLIVVGVVVSLYQKKNLSHISV